MMGNIEEINIEKIKPNPYQPPVKSIQINTLAESPNNGGAPQEFQFNQCLERKYKPSSEVARILDRAMAHINSVPYKVSGRWLFYRLLQEGIFSQKSDVKRLEGYTSKARKNYYGDWSPKTLADNTRAIIWRGIGSLDIEEWINGLSCDLDKLGVQDTILLICYEAKAMTGQFEYYTSNIPLIAFGGDASIHYKKEIAEAIELLYERYDKKKPVVVLYFGDCDHKGRQIYESAFKDIRSWCEVAFDLVYCGLTIEQALAYDLPSNPDKPSQYQWEALTDEQAGSIIRDAIRPFQDLKKIEKCEEHESKILTHTQNLLLKVDWSKVLAKEEQNDL